MTKPIRIGILGPESSGKSTLAKQLVAHFGGAYYPEYARTYVEHLQRPYTMDDVLHIAEQNRREYAMAEGVTFYDTELIITKVWLDEVYGQHPSWMDGACRMDYYLLLQPDLPWIADSTRENGGDERREQLFQRYLAEIKSTNKPYSIVGGQDVERLENAIKSVCMLIEQQ